MCSRLDAADGATTSETKVSPLHRLSAINICEYQTERNRHNLYLSFSMKVTRLN